MRTKDSELQRLILNSSSEDSSMEEFSSYDAKQTKLSKYSFLNQIIPTQSNQASLGLTITGIAAGTIFLFAVLSSLQVLSFGLTLPLIVCAIALAGLIIACTSEFREEPTAQLP